MKAHSLFVAVLAGLGLGLPAGAAERDVQDVVYLGDKGPVLMRLHLRIDGKPLVDVWEKFVGKLFTDLDVDGDGVLSKTEAGRMPPIPVLFNNGPGLASPLPNVAQVIDRNRDGKITKEELTGWLRNSAPPFQFRTGGAQLNQVRFVVAGQVQPPSADAINAKLFTLLDADKDGKLSREELARAPSVLHKHDLDDDEMVSAQEMTGNVDSNDGRFAVRQVAFVGEPANNNGPFVPVKAGEANKELAQRLLNRYGLKGQKSQVKRVDREDLGLDEATFQRLDKDENGKLDRDELARFAQREPDLELRVRLGKRTGKEPAIEMVQAKDHSSRLAKAIRAGKDGTVTLELGSTQLEFGDGTVSSGPEIVIQVQRQRQRYLELFRAADTDNNGYLDEKEIARQGRVFSRALFHVMDRDGDGKLFRKEVIAYLDTIQELQKSAMSSCASLSVKDQGRGLFDLVDANGDGRLGVREMRQMVKLIDQLDRDGDGRISRGEIPHKYRVDVRRGPSQGNQLAQNVVFVSRNAMNNQASLPGRSGPVWFQKMDRNHDGDVSRKEFLGTDEEFRKIDRDGDGLISLEEAAQADEMFRKKR